MTNFMKWRYVFFFISALVLVPGIFSLLKYGLRPAIDFVGGSVIEVQLADEAAAQKLTTEPLAAEIQSVFPDVETQISTSTQIILRGKTIDSAAHDQVLQVLNRDYPGVTELRYETVGPIMGRELVVKTAVALLLAAGIITLYIARQFKEVKYGVSAVLAMLHDTLVMLGIFSILGWTMGIEVDALFVTALLTTLSFSVHDTIVVFDRIREIKAGHPRLEYETIINASILQTLSRSLNNSITIIVMLLALVLLGGETVKWFAMALLVGAVTGTYSSTFTAAPLLIVWEDIKQKLATRKR